jgi:hypothetical protein
MPEHLWHLFIDLSEAHLWEVIFGNTDLSHVKGLETTTTWELVIDLQTLSRFEGRFPEPFLRGANIPDSLKHLLPALSREGEELGNSERGRTSLIESWANTRGEREAFFHL